MKIKKSVFFVILILTAVMPTPCGTGAAEFDIDGPRVLLRRLQYCRDCGAALLVTHVHPGVLVRCPECGREQPRIADEHLLTQLRQLCRLCEYPLDTHGRQPGDVADCDNCHTRQILTRDAFPSEGSATGLGFVPGFPPGTGRKSGMFARESSDFPVAPIPLEDDFAGSFPPVIDTPARNIPRPPEAMSGPAAASVTATVPPARPPDEAIRNSEAVVDVPAVTIDLFGGARTVTPDATGAATPASGRVLARVDGAPVYAREVERVLAPMLERLRERAGPEEQAELAARADELRREVLERLIDRELAVREAGRLGYTPDPAAVRGREAELARLLAGSGADIRREAERDVALAAMRERFGQRHGAASPEAVREFYRLNPDMFMRPRLLALSRLVVYQNRQDREDRRDHREIAREISLALERGRRFDELRRQYDEFGPGAGVDAAEPELLPEGAYAAQVIGSAGDLRRGAVFGPVFMDGLALFGKVEDERPAGPAPFGEVEKEIRRRLEAEAEEKNLDAWLKGLRRKAEIEVQRAERGAVR